MHIHPSHAIILYMDISLKNPNRKAELDEEIGLAVYFLTKQDTLYPTKSMPIYKTIRINIDVKTDIGALSIAREIT